MKFIYRPFTEADLTEVVKLAVRPPYGALPSTWAVDGESGAKLICWGGRGHTRDRSDERPDQYMLLLPGRVVSFSAWGSTLYDAGGAAYKIEVLKPYDPNLLDDQQLREAMTEGLSVLWRGIHGQAVREVAVIFPPTSI